MKHFLALAMTACGVAALACSSPVTATQACTDLATAVCNKTSECAPPVFTEVYGDVGTCVSRTTTSCEQALAAPGTGDTPDFTDSCSQGYTSASCTDLLQNNQPQQCVRTTFGTVGAGSACGADGQCSTGVCQIDPTTGCGTCIQPAQAGGACKSSADCVAGLVCAATAQSTTTCVAPVGQSQACSTAVPVIPCQAGLLCSGGNCVQPLAAGSACDPKNSQCDTLNGYWCTPKGTRCVAIKFAGPGETCGYDSTSGDLTACTGAGGAGGCQNVDQKTLQGTCAAAAADGAACDASKGPFCEPPANCISGTCQVVDPSTCH